MIHSQDSYGDIIYNREKYTFYGANFCFRFLHSHIGNFALNTSVGVGGITRTCTYNRKSSYIINPNDNRSAFGGLFFLGIEYRPVKFFSVGVHIASITEIANKEKFEYDLEFDAVTLGLNFHF